MEPLTPTITRIADRVADAWTYHCGPSRVEIPAGVCVAIALTRDLPARGHGLTDLPNLPALSPTEVRREMWMRWNHLNRLHLWARPRWLCLYGDLAPTPWVWNLEAGVQAVAAVCVEEGLAQLLADDETRLGADVLGHIRHRLVGLLWSQDPSPLEDDRRLSGPTRSLLASAADGSALCIDGNAASVFPRIVGELRRIGRSPAALRWHLREIHELSAAVLTASCVLWEVGEPLIGIAEHGEWVAEALEEREELGF
ncbi:hypothetical protein [Streptomonospora salina]|uniref:Uncharacterized protein n=1 Tax=Streptomonospora salina TaxID=104205 RepID=A0A841EBM3_9ACTN|nr:hypothetical protein [Streptomonospora salina]MBB5998729.1 hypothetical protein [Streptomonospora salina]